MADKARLFDLNDQQPVIQLIAVASIVILAGTLLFYLFVFAGSVIFRTDMSEMLSLPALDGSLKKEPILKYIQVSQQIALSVIPALAISTLLRQDKESFLKTNQFPGSIPVLMVILLALLIIPVASFAGMLNSRMNLPEWLSGVEKWIRTKEDIASDLTGLLLKSSGIGELMLNILILAMIPAIAEEMIFRGVLQQILCRIFRSAPAGIWITAFFSVQFISSFLDFFQADPWA